MPPQYAARRQDVYIGRDGRNLWNPHSFVAGTLPGMKPVRETDNSLHRNGWQKPCIGAKYIFSAFQLLLFFSFLRLPKNILNFTALVLTLPTPFGILSIALQGTINIL